MGAVTRAGTCSGPAGDAGGSADVVGEATIGKDPGNAAAGRLPGDADASGVVVALTRPRMCS